MSRLVSRGAAGPWLLWNGPCTPSARQGPREPFQPTGTPEQ